MTETNKGTKAAQEAFDAAMSSLNDARARLDAARELADERIGALEDEVQSLNMELTTESARVSHFKSERDLARAELDAAWNATRVDADARNRTTLVDVIAVNRAGRDGATAENRALHKRVEQLTSELEAARAELSRAAAFDAECSVVDASALALAAERKKNRALLEEVERLKAWGDSLALSVTAVVRGCIAAVHRVDVTAPLSEGQRSAAELMRAAIASRLERLAETTDAPTASAAERDRDTVRACRAIVARLTVPGDAAAYAKAGATWMRYAVLRALADAYELPCSDPLPALPAATPEPLPRPLDRDEREAVAFASSAARRRRAAEEAR